MKRGGENLPVYTKLAHKARFESASHKEVRSQYHVPEEAGRPVNQRTDATDKLQVLGLRHPLLDQIEDEAGRNEGHRKDDADGHHCVH